jgi:serine/threonine protein kinase
VRVARAALANASSRADPLRILAPGPSDASPGSGGSEARLGDVIAGRFELEAFAGRGGMGVVYRARDRQTGHVVALKLLSVGGVEPLEVTGIPPFRADTFVAALARVLLEDVPPLRRHAPPRAAP